MWNQIRGRDSTPDRWQSKTFIQSTNSDQKLLETEFSIGICRPTGDKWQLKTLFLAILDPRSSIVKSVFDCRLSGEDSESFIPIKTYVVGSQTFSHPSRYLSSAHLSDVVLYIPNNMHLDLSALPGAV